MEEQDAVLHLEVMNANVVTDDRLGEATVAIGHLETKTWCRLVEDLGQHATLELDVFFQPNEQYHLNHELRQDAGEVFIGFHAFSLHFRAFSSVFHCFP